MLGGSGGGAGGGAILIASSLTIAVNGSIIADGGAAGVLSVDFFQAGGGSGGAIRLISNKITGTGTLTALGGTRTNTHRGSFGRIRLEAFQHQFSGAIDPVPRVVAPGLVFLGPTAPSVRVVSVGGVAVPDNPTGSFVVADVTVDLVAPAILAIEANNIPLGTIVQLTLTSESGPSETVASTPLAGTADTPGGRASVPL